MKRFFQLFRRTKQEPERSIKKRTVLRPMMAETSGKPAPVNIVVVGWTKSIVFLN